MFLQTLSFLHNLTTMLFGIFISAFFLGVKQNAKNVFTLFSFSCFEGALYIMAFLQLGEYSANQLYALIIHLPLILFLILYYKYSLLSSCISVCSAYLCCQISNWIGLLALTITGSEACYYVLRILITLITYFLLCRSVCHTTQTIFTKEKKDLIIIGFLPCAYYIFDYACTKLSDVLYSGNKTVVEFMGFAFCISYFAFLFIYFEEYESSQEIRQYNDLIEIRLSSIQQEINQVRKSERRLAILRHDMRHHLNIILTQMQNGNTQQSIDYIREISNAYDETVITSYCKNETVNSVLSIYQTRFADKGFTLDCSISIGQTLPCPDMAVCTILSNALENIMHALEKPDIKDKRASLVLFEKKKHLLFQFENPVQEIPRFVDGMPVSLRKDHGTGVKSIAFYVEQLNGSCHFSVQNHTFILKIII